MLSEDVPCGGNKINNNNNKIIKQQLQVPATLTFTCARCRALHLPQKRVKGGGVVRPGCRVWSKAAAPEVTVICCCMLFPCLVACTIGE